MAFDKFKNGKSYKNGKRQTYQGRVKNYNSKPKSSKQPSSKSESHSDSDSGPEQIGYSKTEQSDSEDDFFDKNDKKGNNNNNKNNTTSRKKNKHAPVETKINHKPVSVVRDIPGLEIKKDYTHDGSVSGLYMNRDIRFDTALGKSIDYEVVRKQYAFLDEYRESEIKEMEKILKDKKMLARMNESEINDLKYKLQSTKSKLESLKKKDREKEALKKYMREQKVENGGRFLTRAEKRKVVLVDRFENMNRKQQNKSVERKRKRKLGKEMRAMEFRNSNG